MHRRIDRRAFLMLATAVAAGATTFPALGQSPATNEKVILHISGRVGATRTLTRSALEAIGVTTITTSTAWTDGPHVFEGVLVRDLLATLGPTSSEFVTARGLNDYSADIPMSDFMNYDVILAWSMDGITLTRRDKGPLWIIYPRDAVPELADERYEHRWVWQLASLLLP